MRAVLFSAQHKGGFGGVVYQVEQVIVSRKQVVRYGCRIGSIGVHTQRGGINKQVALLQVLLYVFVAYSVVACRARYIPVRQP